MWDALHIARGCFKVMKECPRDTYDVPFAHLKRRFRKPPRPRDVNADEDEIITSTNMSNVNSIARAKEPCHYDSNCWYTKTVSLEHQIRSYPGQ
jgi:hypothetical protein